MAQWPKLPTIIISPWTPLGQCQFHHSGHAICMMSLYSIPDVIPSADALWRFGSHLQPYCFRLPQIQRTLFRCLVSKILHILYLSSPSTFCHSQSTKIIFSILPNTPKSPCMKYSHKRDFAAILRYFISFFAFAWRNFHLLSFHTYTFVVASFIFCRKNPHTADKTMVLACRQLKFHPNFSLCCPAF